MDDSQRTNFNLYKYMSSTGIIVPDVDDVRVDVENEFKNIFGSDLDVTTETPIGRLIESLVILIDSSVKVNAQSANQFNPTYATGVYLDSIAQVYGLTRYVGLHTKVNVDMTFTSPCTLPKGSQVISTTTHETFETKSEITVGNDLEYPYVLKDVPLYAENEGPIFVDPGTVTNISTGVLGWVSCTNRDAQDVIGTYRETDAELRERILSFRSVGVGFLQDIKSRIGRVTGVKSVNILENNGAYENLIKGVQLDAHSLFICVVGGEGDDVDKDIAMAIRDTKPAGTGLKSNAISGSVRPKSYTFEDGGTYYWFTAVHAQINASVSISTGLYTGNDVNKDISDAIKEYLGNLGIGDNVYPMQMASFVANRCQGITIKNILTSKQGFNFSNEPIEIYAYEVASVGDISITIS